MAFIEFEKSVRKNDWSMHELHSHAHYEIYFLSKGKRSFFLSNALYKLEAPALIIIQPHVMHKTEGSAFERYNVNVSDARLDPFQKEVFQQKALHIFKLTPTENQRIIDLFEQALQVDKRQKNGEYILNSIFSYLVLTTGNLQTNHQLHPTASASGKVNIPPLVLKVIDYLNAYYPETHTLDSLADKFFVSKPTLMYNFKKYTNCSPIDFLLNVRLTNAKALLMNTNKRVQEISELCGFSSANYFGLIFKEKEGVSPVGYRKIQRAKL